MPLILNGTTGVSGVDGSAGTPSYQGTDTNTGIFYPAADTIAFAEGGAEIARFDSSGNLGIGTSIPNIASGFTNLVVSDTDNGGIVYVDRAGGARGYFYANGTSSVVLGNTSSIPLVFNTADTERMRIDSSGSLLVGTTLNIYPSANRTVINVNGTSQALIGMQTGGNARAYILHDGTDQSFWNQANGIQAFATNNTERMRITSGGDVLVGTTSSSGVIGNNSGVILGRASTASGSFISAAGSNWNTIVTLSNPGLYIVHAYIPSYNAGTNDWSNVFFVSYTGANAAFLWNAGAVGNVQGRISSNTQIQVLSSAGAGITYAWSILRVS